MPYSSHYRVLQIQNLCVCHFNLFGKVLILLINVIPGLVLLFSVSLYLFYFSHDFYFEHSAIYTKIFCTFELGIWKIVIFFLYFSVTMVVHGA